MKPASTSPADLKLRPRFALQRKSGAERVLDQHGRDLGHLNATFGSGWNGGGAAYEFYPNELGVSLGLRRVWDADSLRDLFKQAKEPAPAPAPTPAPNGDLSGPT